MHRIFNSILVTGGSGFIGSNFIENLFFKQKFEGTVVNLDKLTYASDEQNNELVRQEHSENYHLIKGDICNKDLVNFIINKYNIDCIVHFAAESHVDRSISDSQQFILSNVLGTHTLLEALNENREKIKLFHHISTDEVYGSLGDEGHFTEDSPYMPNSPYSASKASSDMLCRSYIHTYGLPITISNCTNNYGPYQHEEKFIPVVIKSMLNGTKIPIYGSGKNVRNWIYVEDHSEAIWKIITQAIPGEQYVIGSNIELDNLSLAREIHSLLTEEIGLQTSFEDHLEYVIDRLGHDWRYSVDATKIRNDLKWQPTHDFRSALKETIQWYIEKFNFQLEKVGA